MNPFYAHIRDNGISQEVRDHCYGAGKHACAALSSMGLGETARIAGLLHDAGKCKEAFQEYLLDAVIRQKPVQRGSVNHSFAGVRYLLEQWHNLQGNIYEALTAELIAYAIGAHHGLFDCVDEKQRSGFSHRRNAEGIDYEESMENYFSQCFSREEITEGFQRAVQEITTLYPRITDIANPGAQQAEEVYFYLGLTARLLLSALIEGDRRDTAAFLKDAQFPRWPEDMRPLWRDCLARVEEKLRGFSRQRPIDRARGEISDRCAAAARQKGGIYRLNVPTGSGKTLSGLRYALTHAARWNKARIFFLSPLLSILDQNAKVIRDYVEDDRLILEHHSNLVRPVDDGNSLDRLELLIETWNSPIVITTLVQFLNTLFSGKTSCIRRFHALCDSVIVIDEVQTVPNKMLSQFNLAITFLAEICGATVLLCSATQPSLEEAHHPLRNKPAQVIPYEASLWQVFRRTTIQVGGVCSLEEMPAYILDRIAEVESLLVVCNKKDQAAWLYDHTEREGIRSFHLSASMCVAHRRQALAEIQKALDESKSGGPKVLCVSTQVVEAGVDISFRRVIRFAAGMDSIVQSAGRCNRHGESQTPQPVTILRCAGERLNRLEEIRRGQAATESLLHSYQKDPHRFGSRLDSDDAISFYYRKLYQSMEPGYQDYVVPPHGKLVDLLSLNKRYATPYSQDVDRYLLRQSFRLAGTLFQVFDENTTDVLVPYREGRQLREALISASQSHPRDFRQIENLLVQAKPYTVSVYQYQLEQLRAQGALIPLFDGRACALTDGYYDEATGFSPKHEYDFWEVSK